MDFALSQEQEMFSGYVRKYLDEYGQTNIAREYSKGNLGLLHTLNSGLAELGCNSINVEEEYGGMGLGSLDMVPVFEECGRALLPGLLLETNGLVVPLIQQFGTEKQKQTFLPDIASGKCLFSIAWLEKGGSYRPSSIQLEAKEEGDDFLLNGTKIMVPETELAEYLIVAVRTGEGSSEEGISIVIVNRNHPNISIRSQKNIDETRNVSEISFCDVRVSKDSVLGSVNQGWSVLQEGMLSFNAALSAMMVGGMEKIVEMATEYANIREQFGQPIGRFQAIKHRIVDMKMDLETARSLVYYANWALDSDMADRIQAISVARLFASEAYIRSAAHNIQIHGGIGFTEELDCQLYVKRARFYENYLGNTAQYYEQAAVALGW